MDARTALIDEPTERFPDVCLSEPFAPQIANLVKIALGFI
jgi:hypothetical protein